MNKILPLAMLVSSVACTTNNYSMDDDGSSGSATCETAINNIWECGFYESDDDFNDPDFYQKIMGECNKQLAEAYEWLNCASFSSCSELGNGKCKQYMPDY